MTLSIRQVAKKPERFSGGHRLCAGCGAGVVVRAVMGAIDENDPAVVSCATGCLEVSTFLYPYTSWKDSFIHSAFENASATTSGAEAAWKALKRRGKIEGNHKFITFGGDGGTYDIGFQSLSGAMERGHDYTYICYDNGAYMNTGVQRSSATPTYANATTTPVGKESDGNKTYRKDLTEILAAHHIPYAAQTAPFGKFSDLYRKSEKAIYTKGPTFLNVLAPCPRGWGYKPEDLMTIIELAIDTCFWPLYEVENDNWTLTYTPKKKKPIEEFLKTQTRFSHLFVPGKEHLIKEIQQETDRRWELLLRKCEQSNENAVAVNE